jgi:hypothetical protein
MLCLDYWKASDNLGTQRASGHNGITRMNTDQPIKDGTFDLIEIQPGSMADEAASQHERGLQEDPRSFGGRFQLRVCLH